MEHAQIMGDDNVEVPRNDVGVFIRKVFGGEWLFIRYITHDIV